MAAPAAARDLEGFYTNVAPHNQAQQHLTAGNVRIYASQYNIGREIVKRFDATGPVALHRRTAGGQVDWSQPVRFSGVNFLFCGPAAANLRNQTASDVKELLTNINSRNGLGFLFRSQQHIDNVVAGHVLNASALHSDNFDGVAWVQDLNRAPFDKLHVLIRDEAHWGISAGQQADLWLQKLFALVQNWEAQPGAAGRKVPLLLLHVSATSDVLTRAVAQIANGSPKCVDWCGLRTTQVARFGSPSYASIRQLPMDNDALLLAHAAANSVLKTSAGRSSWITADYLAVTDRWMELIGHPMPVGIRQPVAAAIQAGQLNTIATFRAIRHILPRPDINLDAAALTVHQKTAIIDAAKQAVYDRAAGNARMLFVRLASNEEVKGLASGILTRFQQVDPAFRPFEVIALIEGATVTPQLSHKAKATLNLGAAHEYVLADLHELPCVVIVNDMVRMGERVPGSCTAFDVRARYIGRAAAMSQNSAAVWIQDVGRMAGHNKQQATVFVAVEMPANAAGATVSDVTFKCLHDLLTTKHVATASHTEKTTTDQTGNLVPVNSRIFSNLAPYTVVLDAEPQIGKTGAVLSFLEILLVEHVNAPPRPPPQPHTPGFLHYWTKRLSDAINDPAGPVAGVPAVQQAWQQVVDAQGQTLFLQYHASIKSLEPQLFLFPRSFTTMLLNLIIQTVAGRVPLTVIDAGCGLHGLAAMLRESARLQTTNCGQFPWNVIGIDLNPSIQALRVAGDFVNFEPHLADMAAVQDGSSGHLQAARAAAGGVDAVVYSMSLFENNITRHIAYAFGTLRFGGLLCIIDSAARFPADFVQRMQQGGFVSHMAVPAGSFMFHVFQRQLNLPPPGAALNVISLNPFV